MEPNNLFSIHRIILLTKQSLIINKKLIAISVVGLSGAIFFILMFLQLRSTIIRWDNSDYMTIFNYFFIALGIIYSGLSFPAFRSKERSIDYLLLPASVAEKYIFEILTRIVVFILIFPLLFWVFSNLEGVILHNFVPELINYKFSLWQGFSEILHKKMNVGLIDWWVWLLTIQGVLFLLIAPFTGASHFKKSPLLKTLFTFTIIIVGYAVLTYFLVIVLNTQGYEPKNGKVLFFNVGNNLPSIFAIAITVINLCLMTIAWFRLKEKEV